MVNGIIVDIEFSMEKCYMFRWPFGCLQKPTTIVALPSYMDEETVMFHFIYGYKSESYSVKKEEILAVGDNDGTVGVVGWSGKYKILNEKLFNENVEEGVIELKK